MFQYRHKKELIDKEMYHLVAFVNGKQEAEVMKRHMDLLNERYDLSQKVAADAAMSGGKPLPVGPTAKLKGKLTWEKLAGMTPDEVKDKNVFPYLPLPHPNHSSGGMLFSQKQIKKIPPLEP